MSVSVANGVSATVAQIAEYRGTTAPTTGKVGDLWQDISTGTPVLNQCTSESPLTWTPVATGGGGGGMSDPGTNGVVVRTALNTTTARTLTAGTGISISNGSGVAGNPTITNSAPDQTVALTAGTGLSVSGTYPNFTLTNTAPDQTVALTAGTNVSISGTYPNFTISASGGGGGGSASFTRGTATLDFGAYPGSNEASVVVTGQGFITSTSVIQAFIMGDSTSSTYTANDHKYLATFLDISTDTATAGTGFTIYARSIHKIQGTVTVNWAWL